MTSTPTQQTPSNGTASASYASAASAQKKQSTPLVAGGSNAPTIVSGSSQHAKSSSVSPVNGRPIMPAVPTGAPAVAVGTNGETHTRKPSVTMGGPNNYSANGAAGGPKIQFGFQASPAVSHSTPQGASAPIPIPGRDNQRVPSPQNSPSPIPQPSASGGRPPSSAQSGNQLTFGSFGGSGETHMRRTSAASQNPSHIRNESSQSMVNDPSNQGAPQGGPSNRGGYPQGGRGRGGYNPNYNNHNQMGYPPNGTPPFRPGHPAQGRGGMAPNFQPRASYGPGTPPMGRASPALANAMPVPGGNPYYFQPPNMAGPMQNQGYYPPPGAPYDPMRGMPPHPYMYPMSGQPHSPAPNFQTPYNGPPQNFAPQPMSRNPSQASEPRPTSSTGQPGAQGSSQQVPAHLAKPVVASSPQFAKPPKKSAITIRNANGDIVDLASLKAPASPAPSTQAKTPPVVASTPTPPPKSATPKTTAPAHTRTESAATKTQAEVQNEFKAKIAKQIADDEKAKRDESKTAEDKEAEAKAAEEARAAEAKAKEDERLKAEQKAEEEKKAAEAKKAEEEKKAAEEAKAKEEAESKTAATAAADEEDEIERMIREMEEEDARREAEQAEISRQKKAAADAKKQADDAAKKDANSDAKLKEAEREAERLEEEKERKRQEASGKPAASVNDALASKLSNMTIAEKDTEKAGDAPSKPAHLTINDKPVVSAKVSPGEKRGTKPAPLNLNTNVGVEPPQPSAALQSLKTASLLRTQQLMSLKYPEGISSPNPALNAAVSKKGTSFKYDPSFLLQFQTVFTEKPSVEFSQQVKTLIGDGDGGRSASARTPGPGRQNSRTGAGGFPMGSFGAPVGKTLPPGTTSAERFAMSQGQMARPPMGSLNSFQRPGGAFPGGSMMSRTPSSSNMAPNSPRTASSRRGASKRNTFDAKSEEKAAKTMPLTAGMKIEALQPSSTGWKPMSLTQKAGAAAAPSGLMDPPTVQRKVKAALNKMTPENFDRISQTILDIAAQSKEETDGRTLRQVIQLTFEKATDEAYWASMYAKFCKRMLETMSSDVRDENIKDKNGNVVSGGALFRKYLLNRCQEEFERGWKTQLPELGEGESKEAALLSDEYYAAAAAKRRGLGLVQFIGELYKLSMLTERIMHECVRKLVDYQGVPDEAEVESLSKLLRTIGGNLDSTDKGKLMMDAYFSRIQTMIDFPDIPSRLKFMLMDVVDLRRAGWVSKDTNKGPKTLDEVRLEAEAAAAQKAAEAAKSNQRGGGGRMPMGRGDARQFSSGYTQQAPNTVGMDDLRRLKGSANRASSQNISLGPTSMFSSRSNSGRRLGPGGSLSRGAEDSGASSRTGTPPTREAQSSTNAFSLLANMEDNNPTSPPSTAASPALAKVTPEAAAADKE